MPGTLTINAEYASSHARTHTHARLTALCPGLPGWAGTRNVKPICILLKQETVSGSGISWAICKPAPRSRQITMLAPHRSVFYRPDALPATQPTEMTYIVSNGAFKLYSNQLRPAEALKATNEIKILCPIARRWDAHRLLNGRCGISMVVHDAPAVQYQLHPSPDVDGCYDKSIV